MVIHGFSARIIIISFACGEASGYSRTGTFLMKSGDKQRSLRERFRHGKRQLDSLFETEIWKPSNLGEYTPKAWGLRFLRILSIGFSGLKESRIGSRAAALCFSSLLGIGPLIAVTFTLSGFIIDRTDSDVAVRAVNRAITFVAPQLIIPEEGEFPRDDADNDSEEVDRTGIDSESELEINPQLAELIDDFIARTQSGTVGLAGMLIIILVAIQLLTTVENAFNAVWGVKRGRSMFNRIVLYWTIISLGAVLGFAALSLFSLSFTNLFQRLPLGDQLHTLVQWLTPLLSLLLLTLLLTFFYRFMPNTHVAWRAAAAGALTSAILLALNNALTFLYVQRVVATYNIYGSLGILPVFMLGLFVFWLILLFGAQITYAVQNVNYLSNQEIWKRLSHSTRELLCLIVLILTCRRFRDCGPAYSTDDLTEMIRAPSQVINECLSQLVEIGYLVAIPETGSKTIQVTRYQPARPLDKMTLLQFRKDFDNYGNSEASTLLDDVDPIVKRYHDEIREPDTTELGSRSIADLLDRERDRDDKKGSRETRRDSAKNH